MLIKTHAFDRRRILRGMLNGAAVTVALPFLDAMLNESGTALAATGQPLPARFGTWFWGLGCNPSIFNPKADGPLTGPLPEQISALEKIKHYVNVFTDYTVITDGKPNSGHFTGWAVLRTGTVPASRQDLPPSLDEPIANAISAGTRFRGLYLAADGAASSSYSFQSADAVNLPDVSAVEFYRKVFGPDFQDPNSPEFKPDPKIMTRKSVLSAVTEQRKELEKSLGAADRARLDQHYTSIRELESRLALQLEKPPAAPTCKVPTEPKELPIGVDTDVVSNRHRAMVDILAMALACNQTKIFNILYAPSQSPLKRKGWDKTHHAVTHEEANDPATGYQPMSAWYVGEAMREWAYLLEKLAATPEGDGNLLDHAVVYAHSDCFSAKAHSIDKIPMFTAGNLYGKLKTGLHVNGNGQVGTKLGLTLQRVMGVPVDNWGTGSMKVTQDITEILA